MVNTTTVWTESGMLIVASFRSFTRIQAADVGGLRIYIPPCVVV